jgi:branched-subunit amino acid aminotransferase/4-amino-4-deoxychorismate lyase
VSKRPTKKKPLCFLNGRYLPLAEATIPALDRGFLFGEGLFETWRTYRGRPFAVKEHVQRMKRSARMLQIPFDPDENWEGRTLTLGRKNGMADSSCAVRLTITGGTGPVTLVPGPRRKPTRLILFRPLEPGLAEARENGVAVHLVDFGDGVNPAVRNLKAPSNYLTAVLGRTEARKRNCFESLYRLEDGTGQLVTTPVADGVLPGITRALALRLGRKIGPVVERPLTVKDLAEADEVFITSSSIEVVPVTRAGRQRIGNGKVGELTRELQKRYRAYVSRALGLPVDELGD